MRTPKDRIRHAISFEVIGLMLVTPLGAVASGHPIGDVGVVSLVGATIATLWNYAYNVLFDHALRRMGRDLRKTPAQRVLHAVVFEAGLLVILLPFIAWYLDVGIWRALALDAGFALFYLVYALAFNWAYDAIYPIPNPMGHEIG